MSQQLVDIPRSLRTRAIVSRLNENRRRLSGRDAATLEGMIGVLGRIPSLRRRGSWDRRTSAAVHSARALTKGARRSLMGMNREAIAFVTRIAEHMVA